MNSMPLLSNQHIRSIVQESAPELAKDLARAGALDRFVNEKAAELQESFETTYSALRQQAEKASQLSSPDFEKRVAKEREIMARAKEIALTQVFELPTAERTTESPRTTLALGVEGRAQGD